MPPVPKGHLPPDTVQTLTAFPELISTLALVDGERVIVKLNLRDISDSRASDVASLVGERRHQARARYQDHQYAIGTPYAELDPERGVLFLGPNTFTSATLRTFDGDDYFAISATTHALELLIQDRYSTAP